MLFRACGGVEGIVNGMDVTEWSPSVDKFLDVTFDEDTMDVGKAIAKEALQVDSCALCISRSLLCSSPHLLIVYCANFAQGTIHILLFAGVEH